VSLPEKIISMFRGREDYVAVAKEDTFFPHKLDSPLPAKWLASEHLSGKRCLGFYLLTAASQCFCTTVDFDNKLEKSPDPEWQQKAEATYYELTQLGLSPLVEISQSGLAAHVWLFFDDAVDSWLVRRFWDAVSESAKVPFVEVYPRQDVLTGKGLGNLIRYPLFGQSRFVDVERNWETIEPNEAMESIRTTDQMTLAALIFQLSGQSPRKPEIGVNEEGLPRRVDRLISREHSLLGRRWRGDMSGLKDPSRSALCQSIACELVRLYVPTIEVEQAIKVWCDLNDYEKGKREDWLASTVGKAYEFVVSRDAERTQTSWTMLDAIHRFIDSIGSEKPHIRSGLKELDDSIDGVSPGEMCVIAARPSHGKTAFGLQWLDCAALNQIPCLFISEEMSQAELSKRALLRISDLDADRWYDAKRFLHDAADKYHKPRANIFGVESCQSVEEAERVIDQHCAIHGVRLVAVDYLQLLDGKGSSRYENVTDISKRLKQAALRNQCAVLALCQLNREIERRPDSTPKMSDLRESGQIEQDADTILFLEWPFRSHSNEDPEKYNVWCTKRRNGPIRSPLVVTTFNPDRQTFGKYHPNYDVQELPLGKYVGNGKGGTQ
jgi:KaiC/GvpD/RAD55 family RecA-like ATPase